MPCLRKFIDIGANLTDSMYAGIYHGSKKHEGDLKFVLERAWANGVEKIIVTGGSLRESKEALALAQTDERLYSTVGCHPTRCGEVEESGTPEGYLAGLSALAREGRGKVAAVGEFGLDYDRLEFCPKETQKRHFEGQLEALGGLGLPLFLHCRGAGAAPDLAQALGRHREALSAGGVVHSFDGSAEEAKAFLDLGLHIGINGCSLKTEQNLQVVAGLPGGRLLLETDAPWCEVRPTHAGHRFLGARDQPRTVKKERWEPGCAVKGRNEPATIGQILDIVAGARGEDGDSLCRAIFENTVGLFFRDEVTESC